MVDSRRNPSKHKKNQQRQDPWFAVSLRPENFIPGLVVGFLLGLFMDLSRSSTKPKSSSNNNSSKQQRLISSVGDGELKMVLVVRQDLKMGAGKIASQCAHAATGIYVELMQSNRSLLKQWEQCGQPKIVVTCKNQQEMNKLKEAADSIGLPTFIVADAGRTQVMAGSKTVLAIGPGSALLSSTISGVSNRSLVFQNTVQAENPQWIQLLGNYAFSDSISNYTIIWMHYVRSYSNKRKHIASQVSHPKAALNHDNFHEEL